MDRINNYLEVLESIKILKEGKKGYITNFYQDIEKINEEIDLGNLYMKRILDSLFLFRKNNEFLNLFFCSISYDSLQQSLCEFKNELKEIHIVVDLVGKKSDIVLLKEVFKSNAFFEYVTLYRMSRNTDSKYVPKLDVNFKIAEIEHANNIFNLFHTYFDPISEQLPSYKEIIDWINLSHISLYEVEGKIYGFVIYDLNGQTSYLRYWFVHPEYRNNKIGSILLNQFFYESQNTKRQLFWVIQSNDNAIKRYKHYGFEPENLYDLIMTNKNIHYEAESN